MPRSAMNPLVHCDSNMSGQDRKHLTAPPRVSQLSGKIETMKVFISSLISDYGQQREAVASAARSVRCQVLRAEDFGARPDTPQQACLAAVRSSDVVVLLLGASYGAIQPSGVSATEEEWQEAVREQKPVLVFVEQIEGRDPRQQQFIDEVQQWATGRFRGTFTSSDELREKVTAELHDLEVAQAAGAADEGEMRRRAEAALPKRRNGFAGSPSLALVVVTGPHRQLLRPTEIEEAELARAVQREAMFGANAPLSAEAATRTGVQGNRLLVAQDRAEITLQEDGTISVTQPAMAGRDRDWSSLPSIIEEEVQASLVRALRFSAWLLDHVDPLHRVTDVLPMALMADSGYMPWRTQAEAAANPSSASMSSGAQQEPVAPNPARRRRSSLTHDAQGIAEDLTALLRRQHR